METHINPKELFNSTDFGFSQIVVRERGKLVFISGQVAWDENRNIVGEGDLEQQAEKTLSNLKVAIEAAGGTLKDIAMLRIYVVNYQPKDAVVIGAVLRKYFGTARPPASSWIGVQSLANEKFMLEIEAQAVIEG